MLYPNKKVTEWEITKTKVGNKIEIFMNLKKYNNRQRREEIKPQLLMYYLIRRLTPPPALTIMSNVFMRNGTYPLMFIGSVYNSQIDLYTEISAYPRIYLVKLNMVCTNIARRIIMIHWGKCSATLFCKRPSKTLWYYYLSNFSPNVIQTIFLIKFNINISSSSSYRAGSTDIPDPLSPLLPIVHRPRQVFRTTTCILT